MYKAKLYITLVIITILLHGFRPPEENNADLKPESELNIGGMLWEDMNRNGLRDPGEPPINGATINLDGYDVFGPINRTIQTAADGSYNFPDVVIGLYSVTADLTTAEDIPVPGHYQFTIPNVEDNTLDDQDSDAGLDGIIPQFNFGTSMTNLDIGIFKDQDNDYIPDGLDENPAKYDPSGWFYCNLGQDPGKITGGGKVEVTGPAPVLLIKDGSDGDYQFAVTKSGTYRLKFTAPTGMRAAPGCPAQEGKFNPTKTWTSLGTPANNGFLTESECEANVYYLRLKLEPGEIIVNNNFPLDCLCTDEELDLGVREDFPLAPQSKTPAGVTPDNTNGSEPIIVDGATVGNTVYNLPEGICEVNLQYHLQISDLACLEHEEEVQISIFSYDGSYEEEVTPVEKGPGLFTFLANNLSGDPVQNPYTVFIELSGNGQTLYDQNFEITVRDPLAGESISCQKNVSLVVNEYCEAPLTPKDVLNSSGCFISEDFYIQVAYPGHGRSINKVTDTGKFNFVVSKIIGQRDFDEYGVPTGDNQPDQEYCQGVVWAVDNTGPTVCIANVVGLKRTEVKDVPKYDHYGDPLPDDGVVYDYEPFSFDAQLCEGDGVELHLTEAALAAGDCNLFACSDLKEIYKQEASWLDTSYVYYTGLAAAYDNCSDTRLVSVYDHLREGGCDYVRDDYGQVILIGGHPVTELIERTFVFEDESGNQGSATQFIYFTRPTVFLPNCEVSLNICTYEELTDAEPGLINSFPYYLNGPGEKRPIDEHACHVTVGKEDQVFELANSCGYKISRTWTIKDWCDSEFRNWTMLAPEPNSLTSCTVPVLSPGNPKVEYEQNVYLKDDRVPTVKVPKDSLWFSSGPFNCEASFEIPEPIVKKECAYIWTAEIWHESSKIFLGVETGELDTVPFPTASILPDNNQELFATNRVVATGLPLGNFFFKYIVEDKCGNVGYSALIPFKIIDDVAPIAKCDDDLIISISEGLKNEFDQYGFTRITAEDVDERSADNCSPEVYREVRRFIPVENLEEFLNGTEDFIEEELVADQDPFSAASGYWTPWHPHADFTCSDVNEYVTVSLQVWDDANGNGVYGEHYIDNYNACMMQVLIQDKTAPLCYAPHDIELHCDKVPASINLPEGLSNWDDISEEDRYAIEDWFGELEVKYNSYAQFADNCNANIHTSEVIFDLNCGAGEIHRYFEVSDLHGNTSANDCYQTIYLKRAHDYCIRFPKDEQVGCVSALDTTVLDITSAGCDLLAASIYDERFDVVDSNEGCFKVFRTYRVINWCQFDAEANDGESVFDEDFELQPLVISRDEDEDGKPGDEDVYVRFKGKEDPVGVFEGLTYIDANCDYHDYIPEKNGGHWRKVNYTYGFYQYTQILKVKDEVAPVITPQQYDAFPTFDTPSADALDRFPCVGDVGLAFDVTEECSPVDLRFTEVYLYLDEQYEEEPVVLIYNEVTTDEAEEFEFNIEEGDPAGPYTRTFGVTGLFPVGQHAIEITVSDGCGNTDTRTMAFEVYDALAPSPICFSSLTLELSPVDYDKDGLPDVGQAAITIWAEDFIKGLGTEECTGPVSYSIHRASLVDEGNEIPAPGPTSLLVSCEDNGFVLAYVYAWDAAGNGDRCEVFLILNDNNHLCSGDETAENSASVAGMITTAGEAPVSGVEINLSGDRQMADNTANDGMYTFTNLQKGRDYTLQPFKDDGITNGVSTFDLITITKHILGVKSLSTPYQMIAADVNNSGSITTLDLIRTRKVILGAESTFSNNQSWRFIDASYTFPDASNPWLENFPEVININNLSDNRMSGNFIAVKTGDVSGDARANDSDIRPRSLHGNFNLMAKHGDLTADEVVVVPITSRELHLVQGFQFTLALHPDITWLETGYALLQEEHFGLTHLDRNLLTMSWNPDTGSTITSLQEETVLFTLTLRANRALKASEVLHIAAGPTIGEAYGKDGEAPSGTLKNVKLQVAQPAVAPSGYRLDQNVPNPFADRTAVRFHLPIAQTATLRVFDAAGKTLYRHRDHFDAGTNEIILHHEDLATYGVLYYTLESPYFTATRKMVVMK